MDCFPVGTAYGDLLAVIQIDKRRTEAGNRLNIDQIAFMDPEEPVLRKKLQDIGKAFGNASVLYPAS